MRIIPPTMHRALDMKQVTKPEIRAAENTRIIEKLIRKTSNTLITVI